MADERPIVKVRTRLAEHLEHQEASVKAATSPASRQMREIQLQAVKRVVDDVLRLINYEYGE